MKPNFPTGFQPIFQTVSDPDPGRSRRLNPYTVADEADPFKLQQPNVAIDAASFVIPSLRQRTVRPYRQQILPAEPGEVGKLIRKSGIAAFMASEGKSVAPDLTVAADAVKFNENPFIPVCLLKPEPFPIPADAVPVAAAILNPISSIPHPERIMLERRIGHRGSVCITARRFIGIIPLAEVHEIVRKINLLPVRIIEFLS